MADALGLESGIVRLVEYDERWPALFAAEAQRILAHTGALPFRLEHIGSTSIPGMCAKPILDIAAGRPADAPVAAYIPALQQAGYEYRGERGVPGREFFCRGVPRAYHLHLVEDDGPRWREYIAVREYLREHDGAVRELAGFKRALAARFARDREGYMHAKSAYVNRILRLAKRARGVDLPTRQ
jgi:GrpB-like predicted nucleotidyltransferase (UPF0157 family)